MINTSPLLSSNPRKSDGLRHEEKDAKTPIEDRSNLTPPPRSMGRFLPSLSRDHVYAASTDWQESIQRSSGEDGSDDEIDLTEIQIDQIDFSADKKSPASSCSKVKHEARETTGVALRSFVDTRSEKK